MTTALRSTLRGLTAQLRNAGCVQLTYDESLIDSMPRSTLVSCIDWAQGTLTFMLDEEQEVNFCALVAERCGHSLAADLCFRLIESGEIPPTASIEQATKTVTERLVARQEIPE